MIVRRFKGFTTSSSSLSFWHTFPACPLKSNGSGLSRLLRVDWRAPSTQHRNFILHCTMVISTRTMTTMVASTLYPQSVCNIGRPGPVPLALKRNRWLSSADRKGHSKPYGSLIIRHYRTPIRLLGGRAAYGWIPVRVKRCCKHIKAGTTHSRGAQSPKSLRF